LTAKSVIKLLEQLPDVEVVFPDKFGDYESVESVILSNAEQFSDTEKSLRFVPSKTKNSFEVIELS
jgi:hypothetical protein